MTAETSAERWMAVHGLMMTAEVTIVASAWPSGLDLVNVLTAADAAGGD